MPWEQCLTPILMMPCAHSLLLLTKPSSVKEDLTPPLYTMVTKGLWSQLRCSSDPTFNIPKIEVNPPTPRKRGSPLLRGCHISPMAPLSVHLPQPTLMDHPPPMATIIDLTEEPSMTSGGPSSAHHQPVKLESQMQVKMSGGMLGLWCRTGGRIMSGAHNEVRRKFRWLGPIGAGYQQSKESQAKQLKSSITDSMQLQAWPTKMELGEIIPPQLVQMSQLMTHTGHPVRTMMAFMPWDSSLVDDGGRIVVESQTVDLDPTFLG
jgi:hypothetical protein